MSFENCEPISFENEIQDQRWKDAMDEEIKVIRKNDRWELKSLPKGKMTIGVRWVYNERKNTKGEVQRYKERLITIVWIKKSLILLSKNQVFHDQTKHIDTRCHFII